MTIPYYLQDKLKSFNIYSRADLISYGYLDVFAWIRDKYPSSSYKTLYDLYCIVSDLPLGSLEFMQKQQVRQQYQQILPCYAPVDLITMNQFLTLAEAQAKLAYAADEIPIGAVIVKDNKVIATGHNLTQSLNQITGHAEIKVLTEAATYLNTRYLSECDLYVTIEPCLMCSGAIINSRLKRVIFGAAEGKTGAVMSQYQVFKNRAVNHHTQTIGPINDSKYSYLLRQFLQSCR